MAINRRDFIKAGSASLAGAALAGSSFLKAHAQSDVLAPEPPRFNSVEEIYRKRWSWDKIVKASHGRSNCMSACSWDIYVRDGIVWREEQNRIYKASGPGIPDFNPRGCQKGACYSEQTYSPIRLTHPMRRVGPRGSGRWERISWDEAYAVIADKIIETLAENKPQKIVYDHGTTNLDFGPDQMWEARLFTLLSCTELDSWGIVGDEMMGAIQTSGMQNIEGSSDDWFNSDYIVIWMGNPLYTRIPDAHFMTEARYNGAKLVVVSPDYSATASKSDLWVTLKPRTDAALILSCAQVMIEEGTYDKDYVTRFTDLPMLVREDTKQFLRVQDMKGGVEGRHRYYAWDRNTNAPFEMPGTWHSEKRTTNLPEGVDIVLDGAFEVTLADGQTVKVRTNWNMLLDRLKDYTPEKIAEETGVKPSVTRALARGFAKAKSPMIYSSWGAGKGYHSDLEQRAKFLLVALAGSHGKPGGGLRIAGWYTPEGWGLVSYGQSENIPEEFKTARRLMGLLETTGLDTNETVIRNLFGMSKGGDPAASERMAQAQRLATVPGIPWYYLLEPAWQETMEEAHDKSYGRSLKEYMEMAMQPGGGYMDNPYMRHAEIPSLFFYTGSNPLRRLWRHDAIEKGLWSKIDLVVGVGPQMNYTMIHSDILLPAAGWYEKLGLKYCSTYIPYMIINDRAIEPLGASKDEYTMTGELAKVITERAVAQGKTKFTDLFGREKDLSELYKRWSYDGKFLPTQEGKEKAYDFLLTVSTMSNPHFFHVVEEKGVAEALSSVFEDGITLADLRREGAVKIRSTGKYSGINSVGSYLPKDRPITPHEWFIKDGMPYPTATGRLQFTIDHPWYIEADEAQMRYKRSPAIGGEHPLYLIGGHARWSIHSQWHENRTMMRLQRGEPVLHVSVEDARAIGASDGDTVEMYNDYGSCLCQIKVAPAMQPGTVCMYHAWQPWHFKNGVSDKTLYSSPIKPIHMVGDYAQLNYRLAGAQPGHSPRDTRVSIRKAS
jgi:DMSO reductase family type II enzyme molybdopterin subunit